MRRIILLLCILLFLGFAMGPIPALIIRAPSMFGFFGQKRYLVVLQNQYELRPTGGFMGSYAVVTMDRGRITRLDVQDIYEPDGQVTAHIDPPAPIQEAFGLGTWRLRDANWDPDWPSSAKTIAWFFEKSGGGPFDGIFSANLSVFQNLLSIVGTVELPDYQETISADNLWERAQAHAQLGFFPGSKQKRNFLSELAQTVFERATRSSPLEYMRYGKLFFDLLGKKDVQAYVSDPALQQLMVRLGWSGNLAAGRCPAWAVRCVSESLLIVEANLGVNKANCCVDRRVELRVSKKGKALIHEAMIEYANHSRQSRAGAAWGGEYTAWVRVYAPTPDVVQGFWIRVPQGETRTYRVQYKTPAPPSAGFWSLLVQKQSGMPPFSLELSLDGDRRPRRLTITRDTPISIFRR